MVIFYGTLAYTKFREVVCAMQFLIPFAFMIIMLILSLVFKVAGKLRLTLPLAYLLIVSFGGTIFAPEWMRENEPMLMLGLYILLGLVFLSWVYSLVKVVGRARERHHAKQYEKALADDISWQVRTARERGIEVGAIQVRDDGTVVHADTGEPILPL